MDLHKNQRSQQSHFGTNSRSARAANAATLLEIETTNMYHQVVVSHKPATRDFRIHNFDNLILGAGQSIVFEMSRSNSGSGEASRIWTPAAYG